MRNLLSGRVRVARTPCRDWHQCPTFRVCEEGSDAKGMRIPERAAARHAVRRGRAATRVTPHRGWFKRFTAVRFKYLSRSYPDTLRYVIPRRSGRTRPQHARPERRFCSFCSYWYGMYASMRSILRWGGLRARVLGQERHCCGLWCSPSSRTWRLGGTREQVRDERRKLREP